MHLKRQVNIKPIMAMKLYSLEGDAGDKNTGLKSMQETFQLLPHAKAGEGKTSHKGQAEGYGRKREDTYIGEG